MGLSVGSLLIFIAHEVSQVANDPYHSFYAMAMDVYRTEKVERTKRNKKAETNKMEAAEEQSKLMTPQEDEDKMNRTEGTRENPADTEKKRLNNDTIPCCVHSSSRTKAHENTENEDSKLMTPQEDEDKMNRTEVKRESPEGGAFDNMKVSKSQSYELIISVLGWHSQMNF